MRIPIFFLYIIITIYGCKKQQVAIDEVISNLTVSASSMDADGVSTDTISAELNSQTSSAKQYVVFKVEGAPIVGGSNGILTAHANFENGKLVAHAIITAPLKPGTINITASPKLDSSDSRNFNIATKLIANLSVPATLHLEPSNFGIKPLYANEVTIVGTMRNANQKPVSFGTPVLFKDSLDNGISFHGSFRQMINHSDSTSHVSVIYSINDAPIGSHIVIKCIALDASGNETNVKDSTILTVIQ